MEYSPGKGLKLSKSNSEDNMQVNWATIEKRIGELISLDRYFTSEEKENYQNWLENEYEDEKWLFVKLLIIKELIRWFYYIFITFNKFNLQAKLNLV